MVAQMDRDAFERTLETREMHYTSRTRGLWHKGEISGNTQRVVSLTADCDGDVLLARVQPAGPACHTGATTCFSDATGDALTHLAATIAARASESFTGRPSYTRDLLSDRNLRLKKITEEAGELAVACADGDAKAAAAEAADLFYHALVALSATGVTLDDVRRVLDDRARPSPLGPAR
jgi:phosphoribosyl-ATP pyrophosphohydrolase/phosphoribosyl-AMP cyclohydrolase